MKTNLKRIKIIKQKLTFLENEKMKIYAQIETKAGVENIDSILANAKMSVYDESLLLEKAAGLNNPKHLVLETVHPSPLSAYNGFFGSGHFVKANEYLIKHGKTPIVWNNL